VLQPSVGRRPCSSDGKCPGRSPPGAPPPPAEQRSPRTWTALPPLDGSGDGQGKDGEGSSGHAAQYSFEHAPLITAPTGALSGVRRVRHPCGCNRRTGSTCPPGSARGWGRGCRGSAGGSATASPYGAAPTAQNPDPARRYEVTQTNGYRSDGHVAAPAPYGLLRPPTLRAQAGRGGSGAYGTAGRAVRRRGRPGGRRGMLPDCEAGAW
jgi:hypothetical protein